MIAENGTSKTRHIWIHAGDQLLHAVEAGSDKSDSIILVHGFPDFWFGWRHQIAALGERHHVIAYDQRGYNRSSKPIKVSDYDIDALAGDLASVVRSKGRGRVTVVGHDWGGAIAWEFARKYPRLLSHLVIINCPPVHVLFKEQLQNPRQLRSSYYIYLFQLPWPVLVIWGVDDMALDIAMTRHFPALCKSGYDIKFIKAGHFVHQERPEAVNRAILYFSKM